MTTDEVQKQSWLFRFIKGMFVGSGFIIPGISGGALAAIFGIYEPIINFLANPFKNLEKNILFFIPIGLGALFSIGGLSWGVSFLLENYETIIRWFFVGAVLGTLPALWKEAGDQGRNKTDYSILLIAFVLGSILLFSGNLFAGSQVSPSPIAWGICGVLIALGILIPGLSPSNFIVYMGLYQNMADGFKTLDMSIIIPIGIGGLLTVILLAKLIEWVYQKYYSPFFHFIFGIVLASTFAIIPTDYSHFTIWKYIFCALMLFIGIILGAWMAKLEEKYK